MERTTIKWMAGKFVRGALLSFTRIVTHFQLRNSRRFLWETQDCPNEARQAAAPCLCIGVAATARTIMPCVAHWHHRCVLCFRGRGNLASGPHLCNLHACGFLCKVMGNVLLDIRQTDRIIFRKCGTNFPRQWPWTEEEGRGSLSRAWYLGQSFHAMALLTPLRGLPSFMKGPDWLLWPSSFA